ncbi:hypothetical protein GCM10029992_17540 [Glycomyces albus]
MKLRRLLAAFGATAIGAVIALAAASPAHADWKKPELSLDDAECNRHGNWDLTWSMTDVTDPNETNPRDYTMTVLSVQTQHDGGSMKDADLDGDLAAGSELPKPGDGSLTGEQVVSGGADWVKLKVTVERDFAQDGGDPVNGRKNVLVKVDLGDCDEKPTPQPIVQYGLDYTCELWTATVEVPEESGPVAYELETDTGVQDSGELEPGIWTGEFPVESEDAWARLTVGDEEPLELQWAAEDCEDEPGPGDETTTETTDEAPAAAPRLPTTGTPAVIGLVAALALLSAGSSP